MSDELDLHRFSEWDHHEFTLDEVACARCRFWHLVEASGECRRRAPRIAKALAPLSSDQNIECGPTALWPTTYNDDWCGEFSLKAVK